ARPRERRREFARHTGNGARDVALRGDDGRIDRDGIRRDGDASPGADVERVAGQREAGAGRARGAAGGLPPPENCPHAGPGVPTVIGASVVITHAVSLLSVPADTQHAALMRSASVSASVSRAHAPAAATQMPFSAAVVFFFAGIRS